MTRVAATADTRLACVVLAAGGSRRLGTPKQLLRRRTRPLLVRALAAARSAVPGATFVVVIGAAALRIRSLLRRTLPRAIVVYNGRWGDGLSSSLRAGLKATPHGTAAALVTLVDQPNVDAYALRRLVGAWRRRPGRAAAARYAGKPGVPAVLPRRYWRAVRALKGDGGARTLLRAANVTLVDLPEAELDIDTPADVAAMRAHRAGGLR